MERKQERNKQVVLFSVAFLWIGAVLGAVVARGLATVTPEQMRQLVWPLATVFSLLVAILSTVVAARLWWEQRAVKVRVLVAHRLRRWADRVAGETTGVPVEARAELVDPVAPMALVEAASRKYGRTVVAAGTGTGGWY